MSEFAQWQASERDRVEAERRAWVGYEAPRDDEIDSLDGEVAFLEDFALAPNSKRTMTYPQKRFQRWLIKERMTNCGDMSQTYPATTPSTVSV